MGIRADDRYAIIDGRRDVEVAEMAESLRRDISWTGGEFLKATGAIFSKAPFWNATFW